MKLAANYWLNEGAFALPAGFSDRSTHIFLPTHPEVSAHLSVARDTLASGENIEAYVERQLSVLKQKLPGHGVQTRQTAELGQAPHSTTGLQIDATYRNGQRTIYQRQAAFLVERSPGVLIFTSSGPKPFDGVFNAIWRQWLASFQPRPTEESPDSA